MDPTEKYVSYNSNSRTTSVVERISETLILPPSPTTGPVWSQTALNGNPGFIFNNAHSLRFNLPYGNRTPLSGVRNPVMMVAVAQITSVHSNDNMIVNIGNSINGNIGCAIDVLSNTNVISYRYDDFDTTQSNTSGLLMADGKPHVYTFIYDGFNVAIRRDGLVGQSVSSTTRGLGQFSATQIVIGDFTDGTAAAFGHAYFIGNIGHVLAYSGSAPPVETEQFLMQLYGITT